jgi:HEAT repeat protein
MILETVLFDKMLKPSQKPGLLSNMLLESPSLVAELVILAGRAKDPDKANCIEALEHASLANPGIANDECFSLVVESLGSKAPRVKWESARVIANVAHRFPSRLPEAIPGLLANTEDPGTVVRWSAAFALGAILKLKTSLNPGILPAIEAIVEREEKNSIRKIYLEAIKKAGK